MSSIFRKYLIELICNLYLQYLFDLNFLNLIWINLIDELNNFPWLFYMKTFKIVDYRSF